MSFISDTISEHVCYSVQHFDHSSRNQSPACFDYLQYEAAFLGKGSFFCQNITAIRQLILRAR